MTTYYKQYRDKDAKAFEVTKDEARQTLEGYWDKNELDRIFENEIGFRLYTPFADVWTKCSNEKGSNLVPMAGFYGTCE